MKNLVKNDEIKYRRKCISSTVCVLHNIMFGMVPNIFTNDTENNMGVTLQTEGDKLRKLTS